MSRKLPLDPLAQRREAARGLPVSVPGGDEGHRCALVASLLASDLDKSDDTGKAISMNDCKILE